MYTKLKKIYDDNRIDVFSMAYTHLLDIGFTEATTITDEEISQYEGNGLMTKDFVHDLVRLARDIALACDGNPCELIQFAQVVKLFDTKFYKRS